MLIASGVHIWWYLGGDPEGWLFQICSKKSFKTKPNTPYGGETSCFSLFQGGVSCYTEKPALPTLSEVNRSLVNFSGISKDSIVCYLKNVYP